MAKLVSLRTCIGCQAKKEKKNFIRVVLDKKGELSVDANQRQLGRGAYLCKMKDKNFLDQNCLQKALAKNSFNYAFRKKITNKKFTPTSSCGDSGTC